jgi:hypothetical protein
MKFRATLILLFFTVVVFSQGDLYQGHRKYNRNERSFGVSLNSNGISFDYKIGKRIDGYRKWVYLFYASWLKHPKEIKVQTYSSGNRFVYGKENIAYPVSVSLGRQKVVFEKQDRNSITIQYFAFVGVGSAIMKPVCYYVFNQDELVEQKFDITEIHSNSDIHSKASFFRGFDEIFFIPYASLKFGFNFDFASNDDKISAIEAGFMFDAYIREVPIMALKKNEQFVFTLFATYRFGKTTATSFN